jgi:hypothetical protein
MRTFRSDDAKQKGGFSCESPPFAIRFSKTCFGLQTAAMLFRNHLGLASKPALPLFSRCHIRCKSLLIAFSNLVAEFRDGLCHLSSLEDCSPVSKNNSTDDRRLNAS